MSTFPSTTYQPLLSQTEDEEEELSELPPTYVTTRGPEKNGKTNFKVKILKFFRQTQ